MTHAARIPLFTLAPANLKAMIALSQSTKNSSLGARLVELVQLRVSQLNGCGVCVDMHWRDLVKQGADPRHLNALAGWREAPFFSARERALRDWAVRMRIVWRESRRRQDFDRLNSVAEHSRRLIC